MDDKLPQPQKRRVNVEEVTDPEKAFRMLGHQGVYTRSKSGVIRRSDKDRKIRGKHRKLEAKRARWMLKVQQIVKQKQEQEVAVKARAKDVGIIE